MVCRGVPPPACVTYVCRSHLFQTYVAGFVAAVSRCLEKEIRNPCSSKKGLVAKACRGGLSRRFVADCLSQAERLCYKPYVAERHPGTSYIPRLLSRTHIVLGPNLCQDADTRKYSSIRATAGAVERFWTLSDAFGHFRKLANTLRQRKTHNTRKLPNPGTPPLKTGTLLLRNREKTNGEDDHRHLAEGLGTLLCSVAGPCRI